MKISIPLSGAILAAFLSACGGSEAPPRLTGQFSEAPRLTGQFIDAAVGNANYETSSGLKGHTDAKGQFVYRAGDTITFTIGGLILGSGPAKAMLTPMDLAPAASSINDAQVVKLLQLLQTLDEDGEPSNGLHIPATVHSALGAEKRELADVGDLNAAIIPAIQGVLPGRTLKTQDKAVAHFADTLNKLEATDKMASLGGISNFIIGGGGKNCSSFNGDTQSSNCSADWTTILANDPVFAGKTKAHISFDSNYVLPTFTYSLTQANRDRFQAIPTNLFDGARKATILAAVDSRISGNGAKTQLSFSDLDGSKPLYADGDALWATTLSLSDFDLMIQALCGTATPGNGADCQLSNPALAAVEGAAFGNSEHRAQVMVVLRKLQATLGAGSIKYRRNADGSTATPNLRTDFRALKLAADGSAVAAGLSAGLSNVEKALLRSAFVDANPQHSRKVEARTVKYLSNPASYDIYTGFVDAARALAGGNKPKIGVVTASADNAFYDADINVWSFRSAGADVVYLPFNGGLRRAMGANQCSQVVAHYDAFANTNAAGEALHMDQVYPDYAQAQADACNNPTALNATLQGLHGIYFSGGDQARHLESLFIKSGSGGASIFAASAEISTLRQRFDAGQLVVAGTSAGNHIQGGGIWKNTAVPMIGGGDSYAALTGGFAQGTGAALETAGAATRYADGGHGFFKYGVLDSHFSRRAREARLVRATKEGGMDYGFGVDENTALVVGKPSSDGSTSMTVLGEAGVFVADVRGATVASTGNTPYRISGVKVHYLVQGDRLTIDAAGDLTVKLSSHAARPLLSANSKAAPVTQEKIMDYNSSNFLKMARAMGLSGAASAQGTNAASNDGRTTQTQGYALTLSRSPDTVFRGTTDRVSYSGALLSIAPQ